jgi:hypothetical protein
MRAGARPYKALGNSNFMLMAEALIIDRAAPNYKNRSLLIIQNANTGEIINIKPYSDQNFPKMKNYKRTIVSEES